MIKNIVFDAGGVLFDLDRSACIREFVALGYPQADALLDPYLQSGIFLQLEMGEIDPQQLYKYIQSECSREITVQQIDNALFKFVPGIDEYKFELLLELHKDYNVYMLSNNNAIMMPHLLKKYFTDRGLSVSSYFDHLYLSYEMGCVKPYTEIFQKMFSHSGMIPSESLMLDDAPANIKTATELGMQTTLITPDYDLREIIKML